MCSQGWELLILPLLLLSSIHSPHCHSTICKMPWKPLIGYFLQPQGDPLRMSLMLLLRRLRLREGTSFAKPRWKQNDDPSRGLWPHLVQSYFCTLFGDSKTSLPGTPILTHVGHFLRAFLVVWPALFKRASRWAWRSSVRPGKWGGKLEGRLSKTYFWNSWFLLHLDGSSSHLSTGHLFSSLLPIPRAWVRQNPASTDSESLGREKWVHFINRLDG